MSCDEEDVCGFTYDHRYEGDEPVDGVTILVCRECGAELIEVAE